MATINNSIYLTTLLFLIKYTKKFLLFSKNYSCTCVRIAIRNKTQFFISYTCKRNMKMWCFSLKIVLKFGLLQFNFVGRILGPRGMTAKQLEQETGCKIMVRGKGSMRDKKKVNLLFLHRCFVYIDIIYFCV